MWKEKNLKQFVLMPVLLACALWAQAQGTFQFHATLTGSQVVPPNSDPTVGMGDFWLTGDILSFRVDVPLITFITMSGTINGPALPGENAPVIFDLGGAGVYPGSSQGDPPGYRFFSPFDGTFGAGPFTLTSQQISELQSGLWYVNITSFTMPDGQLRGQILPVPEPSTLALFGVAGAFLVAYAFRRRARSLVLVAASQRLELHHPGKHQPRHDKLGFHCHEHRAVHDYGYRFHEQFTAVLSRDLQTIIL